MRIGIVADDLTGACDAAAAFVPAGPVRVGIWPHLPLALRAACVAFSTEVRERPALAFERTRIAVRLLRAGCDRLYLKVDSQLRGNLGQTLAGALADWPGSCLLAPALPAMGRVTVDGIQRWPGGAANVRERLGKIAQKVPVADARSDADLARIARRAVGRDGLLLAGTAGLAGQLPPLLGVPARPQQRLRPNVRRPLAVVGSRAAREQAAVARRRGWEVLVLGPDDKPPDLAEYDGLLLTGGETAVRVLQQLGAKGLELRGSALPLMPIATIVGGGRDGLPLVLKAGSFGGPDAIDRALAKLRWQ